MGRMKETRNPQRLKGQENNPNGALVVKDLKTKLADANLEILTGLNLKVLPGEVHIIMGPNGSGKSTLAKTLMGHPKYVVTSGQVTYR